MADPAVFLGALDNAAEEATAADGTDDCVGW